MTPTSSKYSKNATSALRLAEGKSNGPSSIAYWSLPHVLDFQLENSTGRAYKPGTLILPVLRFPAVHSYAQSPPFNAETPCPKANFSTRSNEDDDDKGLEVSDTYSDRGDLKG